MSATDISRKGVLKHGDLTVIARQTNYSIQHVSQVVRGARPATPKLRRAIDRLVAKRQAEAESTDRVSAVA